MRGPMQGLELPDHHQQHWRDALPVLLNQLQPGSIRIDCGEWLLTCGELTELRKTMAGMGCSLLEVSATNPETLVSANALGLAARLSSDPIRSKQPLDASTTNSELLFHQGTLRSGDQLQSDGHILLFGDVNPGALIRADGDVMVWGRLRGTAHAGLHGKKQARIIALQLRPLQLRIADVVARGPEDQPQTGLVEQARLHNGEIVIEPAPAQGFIGR